MAHGAPDWHKLSDVDILAQTVGDIHINIAGQDISEIINRPTYGAAFKATSTKSQNPSTGQNYISITGTGIIYGGYIYTDATKLHPNDVLRIIIDGEIVVSSTWEYLRKYRPKNIRSAPIILEVYDEITFIHMASINREFTFESSCVIYYANNDAVETIGVNTELYYAVI